MWSIFASTVYVSNAIFIFETLFSMSSFNINSSTQELDSCKKVDNEIVYSGWQNVKIYVEEYCVEGSLHGLKYLAQSKTIIEK